MISNRRGSLLDIQKEIIACLSAQIPGRHLITARSSQEYQILRSFMEKEEQKSDEILPPSEPASPVTRSELHARIEKCTRCPAVIERRHGVGSGKNGLMILLNTPRLVNRVEKDLHRTESVNLLRKMVTAMECTFEETYITNLRKCESGDPLVKPSDMLEGCLEILAIELSIILPRVVLVMGDIKPLQKVVHNSSHVEWFTVEHPITLIRNPDLKRDAWRTMQLVMRKLQEKE